MYRKKTTDQDHINNLKLYMFRNKLFAKDMAKLLGCSTSYFSEIMGGRSVSERMLWKINNLLSDEKKNAL